MATTVSAVYLVTAICLTFRGSWEEIWSRQTEDLQICLYTNVSCCDNTKSKNIYETYMFAARRKGTKLTCDTKLITLGWCNFLARLFIFYFFITQHLNDLILSSRSAGIFGHNLVLLFPMVSLLQHMKWAKQLANTLKLVFYQLLSLQIDSNTSDNIPILAEPKKP